MLHRDNVNRKSTVKSLQEEIASLHVELLEVRQANAILQGRMKRMHDDTARLGGRVSSLCSFKASG